MCLVFIVACDDKPTFNDTEKNFYKNRLSFNELATITCKLGQKKQFFSYSTDSFSYSPEKIKPEWRNKEIDALLVKVGGSGIYYKKTPSDNCSLVVGYYVRGFAGSGISYSYSFQKESITTYEKEKHTFEKFIKEKKDISFDMPLNNGWHFTFKYT